MTEKKGLKKTKKATPTRSRMLYRKYKKLKI